MRGSRAKSLRGRNNMRDVEYTDRTITKHYNAGIDSNGKPIEVPYNVYTRSLARNCGRHHYQRIKNLYKRTGELLRPF